MNKFTPLGISNQLYQIDGSRDTFSGLELSGLNMSSGFVHSSTLRYMLTCNIIQYHCISSTPVVIDIGCGPATFKSFWDKNYLVRDRKIIDYTGLEITTEYVDDGISKGHQVLQFDANNQDIQSLVLPRNADVILMQQFIEHIDRRSLDYMLDCVRNMLSDNGILIVSAPNPKYGTKILEHHHDYEYTLDEITDILLSKGYSIERTFGWLGFGIPDFTALTPGEKEVYDKLRYISDGYASAVMCMINDKFAPYYYLVIRKND